MSPGHSAAVRRLSAYPFVVVSWIDEAGYPMSVATDFEVDAERGSVILRTPQGDAASIPIDQRLSLMGSHIRPKPGEGYDERRYLQLWGTAELGPDDKHLTFTPSRAWGWDEAETPFFEYAERSVPQSRRYLAQLSVEKGRQIRPRLGLGWLFLRTTRLPFLSATAVPVLLGVAIAARHGSLDWWLAALTLIGASLAHLGTNVANDIFDTRSGADEANLNPTQFSGGSRVLLYDLVTMRRLVALDLALYGGAVAIGLFLVWVTGSLTLLVIGIIGIGLGIAYTAPPLRLVYRGIGEFAVAAGFGPVMVLGAYVVQTGRLSWEAAVASVPLAILVALILYVNEIPDRQSDGSAGKRTLVVRLSPRVVTAGYLAAALTAFAAIGVGVGVGLLAPASLLAVAAIPLVFRVYRGIGEHYASPYALMSVMATNVSVHLLVGVLLIAGYVVTIIGAALR